jgi:putative chitinase
MMAIGEETLHQVAPHVGGSKGERQAQIIHKIGPVLAGTLDRFEINNGLRVAHFLAQTCHESDGFCTTVEYASGQAYEDRIDLGNTHPGDGVRYKGRGLIQLTGRSNYQRYGDLLKLDLTGHPEIAADPATSLVIACEFWHLNALNAIADRDDIETITRRINGGLNGLDNRRACLARARAAIAGIDSGAERPTLQSGDQGDWVTALQLKLRNKGFSVAADGDFGPVTERAVKELQARQGLPTDGVVGERTWLALT